ncbi:hypothetical protein MMYC01_207566 [Madurella mycetomatis]|uniref:JmjC domain-containing protein n=1 Tax=Madurella mycetomatis TaxID=100816 RepID=A0A175W0J7_9PEZI|nr:hypothetical protein MMYC01_207566 [Madurella mycetomatis]
MSPTILCPSPSNACAPPDTSDEKTDDLLLLSSDHIQQVAKFRDEIRRKTKPEKYELCVQVRNDLLEQHTGVQLLIAACEHVMFTHCTEYKDLKEARVKPSAMQSDPEWDRFLDVAEDSHERKSRCLSALKTVARHWGQDVVRHYLWGYKGVKYCHGLCTASRKVPVYKIAAKGLSLSMLKRSQEGPTLKRRPIRASPNPIEQSDLDYLSRHPPEDELAIELPDGFGFDKFGLVVCKEYAAVLPEPDDTGAEMPTQRGGAEADDATGPSSPDGTGPMDLQERASASESRTNSDTPTEDTAAPLEGSRPDVGHDHHQLGAESAEDTVTVLQWSEINSHNHHPSAPPETSPIPHSPTPTGMTLRARPEASYREPLGGGYSKPKQSRLQPFKVPKIPPRCCPAEVPLALLSNPLMFGPEVAVQFSPFIEQLCRPHLQVFAVRTSAIAFVEKAAVGHQETSTAASISTSTNRPVRRRASSLPDISLPDIPLKRPRVNEPPSLSTNIIARPIHNHIDDNNYRRQVLAELEEKSRNAKSLGSHGDETNDLVRKLLENIKQPNTDSKRGIVEASFCTGDEAAMLVESASPGDAPIITEGQQQFQWGKGDRPIIQLFRRMGALEKSVSVQIPSRKATTSSFEVRTMSEVRERFLNKNNTSEPWNILDLQSPVPHCILPNFLTGENCQLLVQVHNTVLMEGSAERVAAPAQQWDEWKNVLEWALLSEGGHNTAPHTDSHGFATWITVQEGSIGFGWMSCPTEEERTAWMADPHCYTGGRWRYVILKPGQSVFFGPGTIHFVFRVRGCQTLALGGHVLQWSNITRWMQVVLAQMANPDITNEEMKQSAPKRVHVVAKLVTARLKEFGVEGLGGEAAVTEFFASVKVRLLSLFS